MFLVFPSCARYEPALLVVVVKQSKRRKQEGRALVKTPSHRRSHTVSLEYFGPRSLASARAQASSSRAVCAWCPEAKAKAQRLERQDTESSLVLGKLARRAHAAYEKGTRLEA